MRSSRSRWSRPAGRPSDQVRAARAAGESRAQTVGVLRQIGDVEIALLDAETASTRLPAHRRRGLPRARTSGRCRTSIRHSTALAQLIADSPAQQTRVRSGRGAGGREDGRARADHRAAPLGGRAKRRCRSSTRTSAAASWAASSASSARSRARNGRCSPASSASGGRASGGRAGWPSRASGVALIVVALSTLAANADARRRALGAAHAARERRAAARDAAQHRRRGDRDRHGGPGGVHERIGAGTDRLARGRGARARPLDEVFRIVNEQTRVTVENPVDQGAARRHRGRSAPTTRCCWRATGARSRSTTAARRSATPAARSWASCWCSATSASASARQREHERAAARSGGARRRRARQPHQGRVPRHPLARAALAAAGDPRLADGAARGALRPPTSSSAHCRRSSAACASRRSWSTTSSTSRASSPASCSSSASRSISPRWSTSASTRRRRRRARRGWSLFSDGIDCGVVLGDRHRLRQLLTNLLANAIKFTPGGGRIDVRCHRDGGEIVVTVRDTRTGHRAGVPAAHLRPLHPGRRRAAPLHRRPRARPIDRAPDRRRARRQRAGRERRTRSRRDLHAAHAAGATGVTERRRAAPPTRRRAVRSTLEGLSILVVDDDAETRESLSLLLQSRGATVRDVDSAAEALEHCARHVPDVIISDISMPEQDGYALIGALRRQARWTPAGGASP